MGGKENLLVRVSRMIDVPANMLGGVPRIELIGTDESVRRFLLCRDRVWRRFSLGRFGLPYSFLGNIRRGASRKQKYKYQ